MTGRGDAPAIVATGLTKRYGDVTAVDDLSFEVRSGAVTGFLGPKREGQTRQASADWLPALRSVP